MKISIITASCNYAEYIAETIESVLAQTYLDWEMIIVEDGSTDNSLEIIKQYREKDARVKLFTHENNENRGLKSTLLLGLEKAQGGWVAFLESDDMWTPDYLQKKVEIAEKYSQVSFIFNDCEFFGDEKRIAKYVWKLGLTRKWLKKHSFPRNIFYNLYLENKVFTFSSVMCKKEPLTQLNFDTPLDCVLDWWLWIQYAYRNEFYYIPAQLTRWRLHPQSYINKTVRRTPAYLQCKAYRMIGKEYRDNKILPFIVCMQFVFYLWWIRLRANLVLNKLNRKF